MEGEEGGRIKLSKRLNHNKASGEVDYKTKAGTAWSHAYLNQKPWHPLSYPNQRRKWVAEQIHAESQRRSDEVMREYAQEQEFFRQISLVSKKEKGKIEMMKAVSFMYVRPPGYNVESAKAAMIADETKGHEQDKQSCDMTQAGPCPSTQQESMSDTRGASEDRKKCRLKDAFGHHLPTEEQFNILKNAPRLETGVPARSKPFGIEVRNVKCVRCEQFGHQSGDRECPLKDIIMPNDESRLRREDPLTAMMSHMGPNEPLTWELKQKPGMTPPRGGFDTSHPNQQIVEDIFDEYGGFLGDGGVPVLLSSLRQKNHKRKSKSMKHKRNLSSMKQHGGDLDGDTSSSSQDKKNKSTREKKTKLQEKHKHESHSECGSGSKRSSCPPNDSKFGRHLAHKHHRHHHHHRSHHLR